MMRRVTESAALRLTRRGYAGRKPRESALYRAANKVSDA